MATTSYPVNHPLAVKLWSKKLAREALKQTWAYKFMGKDSSSLIRIHDETEKGAGDRITVGLRMLLTGNGITGDGTLEGNEEALTTYNDNLFIDQLRNAVRSSGRMSEQRVNFSVREECRLALQDWIADKIDTGFINQLSGYDPADIALTGMNAVTDYDANHVIYADGRTTEATVCSASASGIFNLKYLDAAVRKAKLLSPQIRPIKIDGDDKYVCFLHPLQVEDMRTSTDTGQWLDIQKAVYQASKDKNPIYSGALGEYNGVIIHESTRIPRTTNESGFSATNLAGNYRAIFAGAQAANMAFGRDSSGERVNWVEEAFDYGNQLGVSGGLIWGLKKAVFNSEAFSTIVINTFARADS
jgi:N4-gp56 family major capsid protein